MAAISHLRFVICVFVSPTRIFGGLHHCAKFGWIRCSSFGNMQVLILCMYISLNCVFTPQMGQFSTPCKKCEGYSRKLRPACTTSINATFQCRHNSAGCRVSEIRVPRKQVAQLSLTNPRVALHHD